MKLSHGTLHYSLAVTCALLLFSPVAADEGSVSPSIWEFTIEPKPMIYKSGNVTLTFNKLGTCYFYGDGTEQNFRKAAECFQKVLDVGCIGSSEEQAKIMLAALKSKDPIKELDNVLQED